MFFFSTSGLNDEPSIRNDLRRGKKRPITRRAAEGRFVDADGTVLGLHRQSMRFRFLRADVAAGGTRVKVLRVIGTFPPNQNPEKHVPAPAGRAPDGSDLDIQPLTDQSF